MEFRVNGAGSIGWRTCGLKQPRARAQGILVALAGSERRADRGTLALMTRDPDEQPARVSVAGLADRALAARLTRRDSNGSSPTFSS
jgi:hypothetical protein